MISIKKLNKRFFLAMLFSDFLFLISVAFVLNRFLTPMISRLAEAGKILKSELDSVSLSNLALGQSAEFTSLYHQVLFLLVQLSFWILVAWIMFKSLSWFFSHKSFLSKIPFWSYVGKFSLLSLFWYFCVIIAIFISLYAGKFLTQVGSFLLLVFFFLIFYLSQVSFALIPKADTFKNTFALGRTKRLLFAFAVNFLVLLMAFWLWSVIVKFSVLFGVLFLFIVLPLLAFCRFNMILAAWQKS